MNTTHLRNKWIRLLPAVFLLLGLGLSQQTAAFAQLPSGVFELDGNACQDGATTADWSSLNGNGFNNTAASNHCAANPGTPTNTPLAGAYRLIDDRPQSDTTYFTGGGSKIGSPMSGWLNGGSAPNKAEIEHSYVAAYSVNSQLVTYFGQDRSANNGDTNIGFWFFKAPVFVDTVVGDPLFNHFITQDPTKVSGPYTAAVHHDGDDLVLSDFTTGGKVGTIQLYTWRCTTASVPTGQACGTASAETGSLVGVIVNSTTSTADCSQVPATANICAIVNPGNIQVPWNTNTSPNGTLGFNEFFEGGVNLSALTPGNTCFNAFMGVTDSAQSTASNVEKDFALGSFNTCKARISLSPLTATNSIGATHTITATVQYSTGSGTWNNAPDGTIVTPTITSSPSTSLNPGGTCTTAGTSGGACTITVNSSIPTTVTVNARATFTVGGQTLTADTTASDNLSNGGTGAATKVYVAAEIKLVKTIDVGPFTSPSQVCFTLAYDPSDTTNPTVTPISSDPAHQCASVTANTTGAIIQETLNYDWRTLATHNYDVTEDTLSSAYGAMTSDWTNPVFVDAVNGPTSLTLHANDPLLPGSLFIHKTVNGGAIPSGAQFQFTVSQCDGTSTATQCNNPSAVPGSPFTLTGTGATGGDQISATGLAEGYYLIHESAVPSGYSINSGDPSIVQVHAGQTTAQTFNTGVFDNALLYKVVLFVCDSQGNLHSASVSTNDLRMGNNAPQSTMSIVPNSLPSGTTSQQLCSEGPASYSNLLPNTGNNSSAYHIDSITIQP